MLLSSGLGQCLVALSFCSPDLKDYAERGPWDHLQYAQRPYLGSMEDDLGSLALLTCGCNQSNICISLTEVGFFENPLLGSKG
jgi:hypothetical protein